MHDRFIRRVGSRDGAVRRRLLAGLLAVTAALAVTGCGSSPKTTFDLSAARGRGTGGGASQIAIPEAVALQAYESERIAVKDAAGTISVLPDAQWADRLPRLIQARLIQTFDNTGRARAARPGDGVTPDSQLNIEIRAFQLDTGRGEVVAELFARLLDARSGRVIRSRNFAGRAPVSSARPAEVTQALDRVSSGLFAGITRWVGGGAAPPRPVAADGLRTGSL